MRIFAALLLVVALPAHAALGVEEEVTRVDVEVDPVAYALDGFSLHVGLGRAAWRLDLGAFAATMPVFAHGQDGFDVAFSGFGVKLDRTFGAEGMGLALGVDAGLARVRVARGELASEVLQGTVGARVGYRLPLGQHFFLMPWVGVGAYVGDDRVPVGDATFEQARAFVFPTVHLGYRVR
ncbi:MAG: hypothetical protein R3F60_22485 [bacterium]